MSRSKVKVTRHKKTKSAQSSPLTMHTKACAVGHTQQAATDDTIAWPTGGDGVTAVHADGATPVGKSVHAV